MPLAFVNDPASFMAQDSRNLLFKNASEFSWDFKQGSALDENAKEFISEFMQQQHFSRALAEKFQRFSHYKRIWEVCGLWSMLNREWHPLNSPNHRKEKKKSH